MSSFSNYSYFLAHHVFPKCTHRTPDFTLLAEPDLSSQCSQTSRPWTSLGELLIARPVSHCNKITSFYFKAAAIHPPAWVYTNLIIQKLQPDLSLFINDTLKMILFNHKNLNKFQPLRLYIPLAVTVTFNQKEWWELRIREGNEIFNDRHDIKDTQCCYLFHICT